MMDKMPYHYEQDALPLRTGYITDIIWTGCFTITEKALPI